MHTATTVVPSTDERRLEKAIWQCHAGTSIPSGLRRVYPWGGGLSRVLHTWTCLPPPALAVVLQTLRYRPLADFSISPSVFKGTSRSILLSAVFSESISSQNFHFQLQRSVAVKCTTAQMQKRKKNKVNVLGLYFKFTP